MAAVPLITVSDEGEFIFHEEAAEILTACKTPIALVAIAGLYRTGKSFLMNVLSGNAKGFTVGNTVNACTKGIWLWSIPRFDEEKNMTTFFVDTEGLGSTNRSSTHDSRIFALALLLSSFFVYNSRGVIDGQAIEDLSLVTNLTQCIQAKTSESDDATSLAQFFPSFLWIVRDFTLKLVDENGQKISSSQYLENCLKAQQGFSDSIVSKNRIRELICSFFRERDCLTMVRPADDEEILKDLSSQPLTALRPEFQKQVQTFLSKVQQGTRPKQMMGRVLTGEMMVTLIRSYSNALNSGGVPVISSAWERVLATQCQEARSAAIALYEKDFKSKIAPFPMPEDTLRSIHNASKAGAKSTFWSKITERDDPKVKDAALKLKMDLRAMLQKHLADNVTASEVVSEQFVSKLLSALTDKSAVGNFTSKTSEMLGSSSFKSVSPEIITIKNALDEIQFILHSAKSVAAGDSTTADSFFGSKLTTVLGKSLSAKFLDEIITWAGAVSEAFRLAGEGLQHDMDLMKRDVEGANSRIATKTALMEQQLKSARRSIQSLKDLIDNEKKRHTSELTRKETEISRYEKMFADMMLMHNQSISAMRDREELLKKKLQEEKSVLLDEEKKLTGASFALQNQATSDFRSKEEDKAALEQSIRDQEKKISELEEQLSKLDSEFDRSMQTQRVQNNLALNKEKAAQKRLLDAEKTTFNNDEKEELEVRAENLKRLQDLITDKSVQLMNIKESGASKIKVANPTYSGKVKRSSLTGGGGAAESDGGKPKRKSGKCNQS